MPFETGGEYKVRKEDALEGHILSLREKPVCSALSPLIVFETPFSSFRVHLCPTWEAFTAAGQGEGVAGTTLSTTPCNCQKTFSILGWPSQRQKPSLIHLCVTNPRTELIY